MRLQFQFAAQLLKIALHLVEPVQHVDETPAVELALQPVEPLGRGLGRRLAHGQGAGECRQDETRQRGAALRHLSYPCR